MKKLSNVLLGIMVLLLVFMVTNDTIAFYRNIELINGANSLVSIAAYLINKQLHARVIIYIVSLFGCVFTIDFINNGITRKLIKIKD